MSDGYIQVPPDSTGKKINTTPRVVAGEERHTHSFVLEGEEFLVSGSPDTVYKAKVSALGELSTISMEGSANCWVHFTKTGVTSSQYALLVDLSDLAAWHHEFSGRLDISTLHFNIDKDNSAVGALKVGVITRIDGTNADVSYFETISFSNASDRQLMTEVNYAPSRVSLGVSGGILTRGTTNNRETNIAALNTNTNIQASNGLNVAPGVGDLILKMEWTAGNYNAHVSTHYHSHATP